MKEIGGYFELERYSGREYHEGLLALNTARNALAYLIKARGIRKLYIPAFLCDSVSGVCDREGCAWETYPIDRRFRPVFSKELEAGEWLYAVNFYGQISNEEAALLQKKHKNVIFDNVQDFFRKPLPGLDTLYSCRKFFGVPDGAYLATDAPPLELEQDRSGQRMKHILGRLESSASEYHGDFKANDRAFRELPVLAMSELTHILLRAIDYDGARQKRNENYALLEHALGKTNSLALTAPDGPYCYPFYCEKGMEVKKRLAQMKIYVATLWPNVLEGEGMEKDYAMNILPLPCDQRYGKADMERIIMEVRECIG